MWSGNSCGICHTAMVPCLSTTAMTRYNNVLLSSTSFQNYQSAPENTIYGFSHGSQPVNPLFHVEKDQEAGEHMAANELVSLLLPNPYNNQIEEPLNLTSYCSWSGTQDHGLFDHMQTQGIQVNYNECYGQSLSRGMLEKQEQTLSFSQGIQNDYSTSEIGEQMATNETDSWLLPNLYHNQIDGSLNFPSYCSATGNQDHGQFNDLHTKGIQVNYNEYYGQSSMEGLVEQQKQTIKFSQGILEDYSTSTSLIYHIRVFPSVMGILHGMKRYYIRGNNWHHEVATRMALNMFSFPPFRHGNIVEETVGNSSNSTRTSSLGTRQLSSRDDLKTLFQFPATSRKERVLRYLEKKKSRKYEKKITHSSRKAYARTRPRVRGRFARSSQPEA